MTKKIKNNNKAEKFALKYFSPFSLQPFTSINSIAV